jgi:hypothetical protein
LINLYEKYCILYMMNLFDEFFFVFDELMGKEYIGKKIIA